jgi:predicted Zn-dependent protease
MGHEVAHIVARHSGERLSQHVLTEISLTAASAALGGADPGRRDNIMAALGLGAMVGIQLPFSRAHEREADEIGLLLMARAGYDPRAAVRVWERLAAESKRRPPEFLSTHPDPEARIAHLREIMPRALEEYRRATAR